VIAKGHLGKKKLCFCSRIFAATMQRERAAAGMEAVGKLASAPNNSFKM
jgi:hypothetical protein